MKLAGFVLVVIGTLALVHAGISHGRERWMGHAGPPRASTMNQKFTSRAPIVGAAALLGGIFILVLPAGRRHDGTKPRRGRP